MVVFVSFEVWGGSFVWVMRSGLGCIVGLVWGGGERRRGWCWWRERGEWFYSDVGFCIVGVGVCYRVEVGIGVILGYCC